MKNHTLPEKLRNALRHLPLTLAMLCGLTGSAALADLIRATGEACPSGYRHVTREEVANHRSEVCAVLQAWDIARLADGGSLSGSGYGCGTVDRDSRALGHALCESATDVDIKKDYFTNLLTNPDADTGDLGGWQVLQNGGAGWAVLGGRFTTSYGWGSRQQVIDLAQHDFDATTLDQHKPPIVVTEKFHKVYCPDDFYLKVELLDAQRNVLTRWDSGISRNTGGCDDQPGGDTLVHVFQNYPAGVRYIRWEDGGKDSEWWSGHYGVQMNEAKLYLAAPNELTNPGLEAGDLRGWTLLENGGAGAVVSPGAGFEGSRGLATSWGQLRRSQTVDLVARGYTPASLDQAPTVYVSELFREVYCSDSYFLKVELLNANQQVITSWDSGTRQTGGACDWGDDGNWRGAEHVFYDYGPGLRYIRWEDGGKDSEWWAGHYGTVLDNAYLGLREVRPHTFDRRRNVLAWQGCGDLGQHPCEIHDRHYNTWCYLPFPLSLGCGQVDETSFTCHNSLKPYAVPGMSLATLASASDVCVPDAIDILDVWGEGRIVDGSLVTGFDTAYNINKFDQKVSNGPNRGKDIPRLLAVQEYQNPRFPIRDGIVKYITLMGAPITQGTAREMYRVLRKGDGVVILYDPDATSRATFESNMGSLVRKTNLNVSTKSPFNQITTGGTTYVYSFPTHDEL